MPAFPRWLSTGMRNKVDLFDNILNLKLFFNSYVYVLTYILYMYVYVCVREKMSWFNVSFKLDTEFSWTCFWPTRQASKDFFFFFLKCIHLIFEPWLILWHLDLKSIQNDLNFYQWVFLDTSMVFLCYLGSFVSDGVFILITCSSKDGFRFKKTSKSWLRAPLAKGLGVEGAKIS